MFWLVEKVKNFFSKLHMKRLSESSDTSKIAWLIKKEKDIDKIQSMLSSYATILSSLDLLEIISRLPVNKRLDELVKYKKYITPYDLSEFIVKKLDTNWKINALKEFKGQFDLFDIYKIFENISPDRRRDALDIISDRLDASSLSEIIRKYIPYAGRKDVLYKYEENIDVLSKVAIIKKMPSSDVVDAIERYKEELSKNNIMEILESIPSSKIPKVLNIAKDKLSSSQLSEIIIYKALEKDRLNLLLSCSDKMEPATISDVIKDSLNNDEKKTALLELKDNLDEKHIAEIIQYYLKDDNELIDLLENKMFDEDVQYFKKIG